jgi:anti-sigma regulatory factor (Ser/Thr protein kinase)
VGWYTGRVVGTGEARGRGQRPVQWTLPAGPEAVGTVRHRLHALLGGQPHVSLDDVVLAASEVVTNAVLHGEGPVDVQISMRGPVLRVEVTDDGEPVPVHGPELDEDAESGRGLFIVDVLASRWGVVPTSPGPGKTVWFEMGQALRPAVPRGGLRTDRWPHNTASVTPTHCFAVVWDRMLEIPGW